MAAAQREVALVVVELAAFRPLHFVVAGLALNAQRALVLVVLLVAIVARVARLFAVDVGRAVAGIALDLAVLAAQRVLGVAVVAEGDAGPVLGGVAALALFAVARLVLVFLLVAADAGAGCFVVDLALVAGVALDVDVLAGQRVLGLVVVELGLFPALFDVAIGAGIAQGALVLVVLLVAAQAFVRRLAELLADRMAALALQADVLALEHVVGLPVVEGLAVELGDLHVTPAVIGVTTAASGGLVPAVQAGLVAHVHADVLVAGHAQTVLPGAIEAHVAFAAFGFGFDVALDQRAWRQRRLDGLRPGRRRQARQQQHQAGHAEPKAGPHRLAPGAGGEWPLQGRTSG